MKATAFSLARVGDLCSDCVCENVDRQVTLLTPKMEHLIGLHRKNV